MTRQKTNTLMAVFAITERDDKSYWTRVGVAYTNRDGRKTSTLMRCSFLGVCKCGARRNPSNGERSRRTTCFLSALCGAYETSLDERRLFKSLHPHHKPSANSASTAGRTIVASSPMGIDFSEPGHDDIVIKPAPFVILAR